MNNEINTVSITKPQIEFFMPNEKDDDYHEIVAIINRLEEFNFMEEFSL